MTKDVTDIFTSRTFLLPTLALIAAVACLLFQQSMYPAPDPKKG